MQLPGINDAGKCHRGKKSDPQGVGRRSRPAGRPRLNDPTFTALGSLLPPGADRSWRRRRRSPPWRRWRHRHRRRSRSRSSRTGGRHIRAGRRRRSPRSRWDTLPDPPRLPIDGDLGLLAARDTAAAGLVPETQPVDPVIDRHPIRDQHGCAPEGVPTGPVSTKSNPLLSCWTKGRATVAGSIVARRDSSIEKPLVDETKVCVSSGMPAAGAGDGGAEALGDGLALGWPPTPDPSDWRGRTLMATRPTPTTRTAAMAARA